RSVRQSLRVVASANPRDLRSFPTRRSSDLLLEAPLVGHQGAEIGRAVEFEIEVLLARPLAGQRQDARHQAVDIDVLGLEQHVTGDRKSTRLNSSHLVISYAVFCLKKKNEML